MKVGDVKLDLGARFRDIGFRGGLMDDLHIFDIQLTGLEIARLYRLADSPREGGQTKHPADVRADLRLAHQIFAVDDSVASARAKLQEARDEENRIVTAIRQIMVMQHSEYAKPTHVLERGEYTEKRDQVPQTLPDFLGDLEVDGKGRLELANWMTHPDHPLTSRVIANRMWHLFFGRGIVVTLEDFGSQGLPPSHPELLDYLARSLMDDDWDLKAFCRRIVLSATYRQSSAAPDRRLRDPDPHNTWLARGPKHRLSAEQLRDAALSASGLLVRKIGGPSVMPYQPPGLWKEAGTGKSYRQATGDGLYRRSLYTFWKRTAPPPSMLTFDATNRESCTPRRELTTTPLQALVFLNDPQFVEASRVLAEQLVATHGDSLEGRWNELFRRLISRTPADNELALVSRMYEEQWEYFNQEPENANQLLSVGQRPRHPSNDPIDVAATTVVVQTIIAYDETIMLR